MQRKRPEPLDTECKAAAEQLARGFVKDSNDLADLLRDAGEEIWCLRGIVRDVRLMVRSGQLKQFDGEPWVKRVMNIGLDH